MNLRTLKFTDLKERRNRLDYFYSATFSPVLIYFHYMAGLQTAIRAAISRNSASREVRTGYYIALGDPVRTRLNSPQY